MRMGASSRAQFVVHFLKFYPSLTIVDIKFFNNIVKTLQYQFNFRHTIDGEDRSTGRLSVGLAKSSQLLPFLPWSVITRGKETDIRS